jgi:long-chain acyl-CoA synthetase
MTEHYLDRLARTINKNWDQPALTDFYLTEDSSAQDTSCGKHYTYGEMYEEMLHVCDIFQALGLKQGDHIAICGTNSAHWAIAYLAIAAYQGVAVTILHSQSLEDIAHQIDFSDAKVLFTDEDLWEELKDQSLPQIEHVINLDNWQILHGKEAKFSIFHFPFSIREARFDHGELDSLAMICFTSGSTGISKGVMLSYCSLSNNITNLLDKYIKDNNNRYILFLPLSHAGGMFCELLPQLCRGKSIYFSQEILDVYQIVHSLSVVRPYMFCSVPKVLSLLAQECDFKEMDSVKQILTGSAQINSIVENKLRDLNIPFTNSYSLTEAGQLVSLCVVDQYRFSSAGKILNGNKVAIAPNGEILIKGESVMLGYYKDPETTARKIDKDGWLHTGDKGHLDEDGYLYVEGRLEQDMIVLPNGENIHPEDIERKINALPEVKESIVLARDGKLVAIAVPQITNDQSQITNTDLRRIILRKVNPSLPLYSQLYDVEITETPLAKTEKQTIKRYLYK